MQRVTSLPVTALVVGSSAMDGSFVTLLGLRIFISCLGLVGNVFLILAIILTKHSPVKSFELFLLGLAAVNVEEILAVNIYDAVLLGTSSSLSARSCGSLRFLTVFGEAASILFSVLISVFRYEKLRDASTRANLPVCLDSVRSAWMVSGICVILSTALSFPILLLNPPTAAENATAGGHGCPPDFFQCTRRFRPQTNCFYKYMFILMCNLLPLAVVTTTGGLTLSALVSQGKAVTPEVGGSRSGTRTKGPWLQRSTMDVLAAMGLFQVVWILYLAFQLTSDLSDIYFKPEIEFFISISYTSICPYVYGIGGHLFSLRIFTKT